MPERSRSRCRSAAADSAAVCRKGEAENARGDVSQPIIKFSAVAGILAAILTPFIFAYPAHLTPVVVFVLLTIMTGSCLDLTSTHNKVLWIRLAAR